MLTRIDLRAQKELEGGRGLKKLEIIRIFREKSEISIFGTCDLISSRKRNIEIGFFGFFTFVWSSPMHFLLKTTPKPEFGHFSICFRKIEIISSFF